MLVFEPENVSAFGTNTKMMLHSGDIPLLESEIFVSGEKGVSGCCCLGEGQLRPAKEPTLFVAQEFQ